MPECLMFHLPDGSFIKASVSAGAVNAHANDSRSWKSADLYLVFPDGHDIILCSVEYETGKGISTSIWDEENGQPVFERLMRPDPEV